jgi:hypothetical protein
VFTPRIRCTRQELWESKGKVNVGKKIKIKNHSEWYAADFTGAKLIVTGSNQLRLQDQLHGVLKRGFWP